MVVEHSEINSGLINDTKNLLDSWTANQTSDDEEDDEEQEDNENDWLLRFDRLGKQLKNVSTRPYKYR